MAMWNWLLLIALALFEPVTSQSESRFLSEARLIGEDRLTPLSRKIDCSLQSSRSCPKTLSFGYKLNAEHGYRFGDSIRRVTARNTIEQKRALLDSTRFTRVTPEQSFRSKRIASENRYRTQDAIQERAYDSRERAFERLSSNENRDYRSQSDRRFFQETRNPVFFDFRFREAYRHSSDISHVRQNIRNRQMVRVPKEVEELSFKTTNGVSIAKVSRESIQERHGEIHSRRGELLSGKDSRILSRRTRSSDRVTSTRDINRRSAQEQQVRNEKRPSISTRRTQSNEDRSTEEPHRESRRLLRSRRISEAERKYIPRLQSIRRDTRDRVSNERYFDIREFSRVADARASTHKNADKRNQLRQLTLNYRNVLETGGIARKQPRRDIRANNRLDKREQYRKPMENLAGIDKYSTEHASIESGKTAYYWKTYAIIAMQAVCVCGILEQILNSNYDKKKIQFPSLWPAATNKAIKVD